MEEDFLLSLANAALSLGRRLPPKEVFCVYVLELEDGERYVGQTGNLLLRFGQHLQGVSSCVRRALTPVEVVKLRICESQREARAVEQALIRKYARWQNVRGKKPGLRRVRS